MKIEVLKSKIHRIKLTDADIDYIGSIAWAAQPQRHSRPTSHHIKHPAFADGSGGRIPSPLVPYPRRTAGT